MATLELQNFVEVGRNEIYEQKRTKKYSPVSS